MNDIKKLDKRYSNYIGIDEAGRGNIAGSLLFCAAKIKDDYSIEDISFANDSKSMSKKKRGELYKEIIKYVDYHLVEIYPTFIDKNGISEACRISLKEIKRYFGENKYLYDGNTTFGVENIETLIKADVKVSIVAAASIIAKVEKDRRMLEIDKEYPEYDWKNNAGYGTKGHIEAIKKYGWTPYHRRSFKIKALKDMDN